MSSCVTTPGIFLMEGDATPVEALPRLLRDLVEQLNQEDFVWLVFFTTRRQTRQDGRRWQRAAW